MGIGYMQCYGILYEGPEHLRILEPTLYGTERELLPYRHGQRNMGAQGRLLERSHSAGCQFESPPQFYKPGINIPILQMRKLNHKVKFKRWIKKRSGRNLWGMRWKLETQVKE
jgi:hypothetical protein